jgi:protein ImuB
MRRFTSIWLPRWPVDRLKQRSSAAAVGPFALIQTIGNTARLYATNVVANRMGLTSGMTLADAMSLVPSLQTGHADPTGDLAALCHLADWTCRWSPWVSVDGDDGLILETTGCDHLFGGEQAMLDKMQAAFRQMHVSVRLAVADTPAAAWGWARFGATGILPSRPASIEPLNALPVAALRIDHQTTDTLKSLGLKTVGAISSLPRASLTKRLGPHLLRRLDCMMGNEHEPISPRQQPAPWRSRANMLEPIQTRDAIDQVVEQLLTALCGLLEQYHVGARQLALHCYRVDGDVQTIRIGTSYPSRSVKHLSRLFRDPLDGMMPGFGFEVFILEAVSADQFDAEQANLEATHQSDSRYAQLIVRLRGRLGNSAVFRYEPVSRHTPELSCVRVSPLAKANAEMPRRQPRPVRQFQAESIEMESTGEAFVWKRIRRRIALAVGPERVFGEWLDDGMNVVARDYFRLEDEVGRRYWVYRSEGKWFVQGMFG